MRPRKPEWLKVKIPASAEFYAVREILERHGLNTVCKEARCPNIAECFHSRTATFMILGDTCTRECRYCSVSHGNPSPPDQDEPRKVAKAARELGLQYVVITSVTRDDLPDGGAGLFAQTVEALREEIPGARIEVLIPDFRGDERALAKVVESRPDVINHNIEVVERLFGTLRPQGSFAASLRILRQVQRAGITCKSGFMIGFGEQDSDIRKLLGRLSAAGCEVVTVGQYQQPSAAHWPVARYYRPEEFAAIRETALSAGFRSVVAGPLVRSSYKAGSIF